MLLVNRLGLGQAPVCGTTYLLALAKGRGRGFSRPQGPPGTTVTATLLLCVFLVHPLLCFFSYPFLASFLVTLLLCLLGLVLLYDDIYDGGGDFRISRGILAIYIVWGDIRVLF